MTDNSVGSALDLFIEKQIALHPEPPTLPYTEQWPSACYQSRASEGEPVGWRPVKQTRRSDMFERLSQALDEKIHPDVAEFYCRYWSDPLPATSPDGDLSLIQVWNEEDMERLRSNLVGHALSKRQQKRPLTFFIACAEPDDNYFISIDNFSGEVLLELPGKPPVRKLAENLSAFLTTLQPRIITNQE